MSTNAAIQQPHVQVAIQLFRERLAELGATIRDDNGVFGGWFGQKRLDTANMTAGAIADAMYAAVVADCERPPKDRLIAWSVPPRFLQKEIDQQNNRPANAQDPRKASSFEERVRASEKKDADDKAQAEAKQMALALVGQFTPTRGGRLAWEVPVIAENGKPVIVDGKMKTKSVDALRADWHKRIADSKNSVKVLAEIRAEQAAIYTYFEKEFEHR